MNAEPQVASAPQAGAARPNWPAAAMVVAPASLGWKTQPYDLYHARQLGSLTSACGAWSENWQTLWDRPFSPDDGDACRECVTVLRHARAPRRRPTDRRSMNQDWKITHA